MANANATFNNLTVKNMLTVEKLRLKDDKILNLTPKEKMSVTSDNIYNYTKNKHLIFNEVENGYGYGMLIDKNEVQFGYGTKTQFNNHNIANGITITKDGINIDGTQTIDSIPTDTINEILNILK